MRAYNKNWMGLMAAICMISSIFAADGVWTNTAGGNWSDAANWKDGVVAEGVDAMAYFTNAPIAHRTVMLPEGGVTLGGLLHDRCGTTYQIRLRGGPLLFDGSDPEIFSERIFTLFYTDIQGTNGLV